MGESASEKETKRVSGKIGEFTTGLSGLDVESPNLFKSFRPESSTEDQLGEVSNIFGSAKSDINRRFSGDVADVNRGITSRLTSRGITGGALYEDSIARARNQANKGRLSAISSLAPQEAEARLGVKQAANEFGLKTTTGAQNVELANIANRLKKSGINLSALLGQLQAAGQLDDDTTFDDILAIANTVAGFIPDGGSGKQN